MPTQLDEKKSKEIGELANRMWRQACREAEEISRQFNERAERRAREAVAEVRRGRPYRPAWKT